MAVLLGIDAETTTGIPAVSNDYVADAVRRYPDVFVGFASVDPWKGTLAWKSWSARWSSWACAG